jgi:acyl-CoA thioesterase
MNAAAPTPFCALLASLHERDGRHAGEIPADWMQGRTTFGGLSAALCLAAVLRAFPGQPPLRSALVSFAGPAGGPFEVTTAVLRAGRSVTSIGADLFAAGGLATRALFTFGAARESAFTRDFLPPPPRVPPPEACGPYFQEPFVPGFSQHFDHRLARGAGPVRSSSEHEHYAWVRHRDAAAAGIVALLAIADVPPPAMMPMFTQLAPLSSMTWIANFLAGEPATRDGWWLLRFAADNAREGYSSQDMTVWSRDGEPVIAGRQSIAIFA